MGVKRTGMISMTMNGDVVVNLERPTEQLILSPERAVKLAELLTQWAAIGKLAREMGVAVVDDATLGDK